MRTRAEKRFFLHQQQRGACALCGRQLDLSDTTLDHRFPKSRGGSSALFNLQAAHDKCNQAKGAKVIPRFVPSEHFRDLTNKQLREVVAERLSCGIRQAAELAERAKMYEMDI
jgi:5-methylcytosine-specific restriction endonuclease McrA